MHALAVGKHTLSFSAPTTAVNQHCICLVSIAQSCLDPRSPFGLGQCCSPDIAQACDHHQTQTCQATFQPCAGLPLMLTQDPNTIMAYQIIRVLCVNRCRGTLGRWDSTAVPGPMLQCRPGVQAPHSGDTACLG